MSVKKIKAEIWIHSHYKTREPVQIDILSWYGETHYLDSLRKDNNLQDEIKDFTKNLPLDKAIVVDVFFDKESGEIYHYVSKIKLHKPKCGGIALHKVRWSLIGNTDEFKEMKERVALITKDVQGFIPEVQMMDLTGTFNQFGYHIIPRDSYKRYKIVVYNNNGKQYKKYVYLNKKDFEKHSPQIIQKYTGGYACERKKVKIFKSPDGENWGEI